MNTKFLISFDIFFNRIGLKEFKNLKTISAFLQQFVEDIEITDIFVDFDNQIVELTHNKPEIYNSYLLLSIG